MAKVLLHNRYLIRELVSRDIHTRYVGSLVGVFWSVLNPLLQLSIYTVIFGKVLEQRFDETASTGRFALFLFCALLPWMAVQEAVTRSARSFIENANLIKKVRFPLQVLPLSVVLSAFAHQCLGTLIFLAVLVANQSLSWRTAVLALPLFALQLVMMQGLSLMVACLNVFVRDIGQILGVAFMLLFWLTPIVYPKSKAPASFRWILEANPLTHMVEAYRSVFMGHPQLPVAGLLYWGLFSAAALWFGGLTLRRTRKDLVDLI